METISVIKDKCVGCRSCEQACPKNCITMVVNQEGFWYPSIDENICIKCGRCLKVCPAANIEIHRNMPLETWAFRNRNDKKVMASASGGASDVAAKIILQSGGIVFGAAYDENFQVRHIEVTENQGRRKLQSSKYVQSDTLDTYSKVRKLLIEDRKVLYTGTPCQIAGLYAYLGGDKDNLYTIDLICHGVPSPKLFEKYLKWQERKMKGKIIFYNFRSKDRRGWGTQYLVKTKTKTKTKVLALDKYGKHFMAGDCYRESCYQCPYANTKRVADLTVGDFWGITKCYPDFYSPKGVSSVLINTPKGKKLFEKMKELADVQEVTLQDVLVKQGNLVHSSARPEGRNDFYKRIDEVEFIENLRVGLQIKARVKSILPSKLVQKIKKYIWRKS